MRVATAFHSLIALTSASHLPPPQHLFSNPPAAAADEHATYRIPTVHESAIQARRILHLETIGTLSTLFPSSTAQEQRPADVGGKPIGLMDYFGDCEPRTGNPTLLAITIATSFKNVAAGSNITLSMRWHAPYRRPYSAAATPRFSLVGHLEELTPEEVTRQGVAACFVAKHPDAVSWLPGNRIHESRWVRLVVEEVYWIGGFGDRAYIGWIPLEEWQGVTREEIEKCRLPGEREHKWGGWKAWLGLGEQEQDEELEL
ncbi:hypothetical protein BU26DRAFT_513995 [Trematosphaeria pertusa]|uniref:CREG-like beta-barrel domain-containing protein n=1 Tax=Trematosphaeria pertusa TaxID=390896 RepID=A0A6A6J369_9PLEO|nr:uncharacterized protein BU26DRAFT_513995 [Trematosphaeria pertusa]KAF2257294.1 hypothetical protein BU26DRAFT_513995 [Trematosphaeria pertusa]